MCTWYRPPSSSQELFTLFEEIIDEIDAENSELCLLGDLSNTPNSNTSELLNIFDIYNLSQTISEPTRIINTSQTLIDLCITNNLDKVKASGALSLNIHTTYSNGHSTIPISDHSLVYLIGKCTYHKAPVNTFV